MCFGRAYDQYTRTISPYLEEYLPNDVDIVAQNIEGSSGKIATVEVYTATPDGHTNMIVDEDLVMEQLLQDDPDYDLAAMTYYANLAQDLAGIAVGENTDINSWEEYIKGIKNEEIQFALSGINNAVGPCVLGELSGLYTADQILDNAITYESRNEAIRSVLSGDAEAIPGSYYSILPYHESENIEMLLELSIEDEPPEETPDAETLATVDVDNAEDIVDLTIDGRTFAGPPDIPDGRTEIWRDTFEKAVHDEEFVADMDELDRPVDYVAGESAQNSIENRFEQWEDNRDLLERIYG